MKNFPPVRGEPACGSSSAPHNRCRKGAAPLGRTRQRQFECPGQSVQKRSRPIRANPPAAVRAPRSAGAEKEPPRQGEHASGSSCAPVIRCRKGAAPSGRTRQRQFECPTQPVQKRSRPVRANTLTQFAHPGFPVQRKEPPRQGEHACGSSSASLGRCRKSGKSRKNFPARKDRKTPILTLRKRLFG